MFALHAIAAVAILLTLALVMLIALRLYGAPPAAAAGLAFALTTCTPLIEGNLAMTETFMILVTTTAVLVFVTALASGDGRQPWIFTTGVLLGIAANYKQVALFDAIAVAMMVWFVYERPVRPLLTLALGFALPHALFAVLFLATGAWDEYWYAVAGSLPLYNDLGTARGPASRWPVRPRAHWRFHTICCRRLRPSP
jgi:4-amino-4-deoxy-L-arabinose transferase-like glycosyltransferase